MLKSIFDKDVNFFSKKITFCAKGGDFKNGALDSDFMFVNIEPYLTFHPLLLQILILLQLLLQLKVLQMALLSHTRRALSLGRTTTGVP